jgi:negative regulator of sigma-B (phosphoserine phosphatase)
MSTTAFHRSPFIEWGVATQPIPGQTVCGDLHLVKPFAYGALVAVVDGLGHGDEAIAVARIAIHVLEEQADQSVITLVKRCHEALINSRGVVLTLASFSTLDATVSWLSVGNVAGLLLRADITVMPPCETALLRGGVVGYQLPPLSAGVIAVAPNDLLVLTTDGIRNSFDQSVLNAGTPQQIADRVMSRHFKGNDDGLVLVVRFLGTRSE